MGKRLKHKVDELITEFQVMKPEQHGFQQGKSIILIYICNFFFTCMDKWIPVTSILFDMSRAFHFICHKTLLAKLVYELVI